MEIKILTPADKFLSAIEFNFDELKTQLAESLLKYQNLSFSDETMKEAKETRAILNKLKTAIDTKRKEIKSKYLEPYEVFESKIKSLIAMIDEPIECIDTQTKAYDNKLEQDKLKQIETYFLQINPFGGLIKLNHICLWNERWLNKTFTIENVKKEIEEKILNIKTGLENIDINLDSPFKVQIRDVFLKTFDLNKALQENKRLVEQEQARKEYEEKQKALVKKEETKPIEIKQEIKEEIKPIEIIQEIKEEVIIKWKKFSVEVSKEQFVLLRQFLVDNNINYKGA